MADTKNPQRESQTTPPEHTGSPDPERSGKEGQKAGESPRRSGKEMNENVEKETDRPDENIEKGRTGTSNTEQGI